MPGVILVCEDDTLQRKMVSTMLTKIGYKVLEVKEGREALSRIENSNVNDIDAVMLDVNAVMQGINMAKVEGFTVLGQIRKSRPDIPVVMVANHEDKDLALNSVKEGANDYILKPANEEHFEPLKILVEKYNITREAALLKRSREGMLSFSDLIGNEDGLVKAVKYGRKAAGCDIPVLITGETGTGKELLARAIHCESKRSYAPFVTVNCSIIHEHTIEKVLIGSERGSFVGASAKSAGEFREARRGTLFLDDIHMLTMDAQVKLLRFLQEKTVELPGTNSLTRVNIRIISSTNCDLKAEVKAGRFREDLYFRVNVLTIGMPSLRERTQDILELSEFFIKKICDAEELMPKKLTQDAQAYITNYNWPGNVREFEGLLHRALVLCESDVIDRALLLQIHD